MKRLWLLGLIFGLTACATAATGNETVTKPAIIRRLHYLTWDLLPN